jgi:hypothetical protein
MTESVHQARWTELTALHESISAATTVGELPSTKGAWDDWPEWYVQVLSQLRLYVTADDIVFLTSSLTGEERQGGSVFALTKSRAILLTVEPATSRPAVDQWDRSMLNQMSVDLVEPYARPESPTNAYTGWPNSLAVTLRYEGREPLSVPYDNASKACRAQLAAQHESLEGDLPHRRRSS